MKIISVHTLKSKTGITLIELLVVVVIVGILAAISIPMYSNYMIRARRADAKSALEQLRASQEMRRAERGGYETNIVALRNTWGLPANPVGDYNITMVATSTTYTGTATAFTSRQSVDTAVPLTINELGVKTPADKWAK